jgi:TerC family integral membrane protein
VLLASLFAFGIYSFSGRDSGLEFVTGYLIEKVLALDNLFVIAVILEYFKVPAAQQHRVLTWGILGAMALRAFFIVGGSALLDAFEWVLYLFGGFLLFSGARLALRPTEAESPGQSRLVRWLSARVPMTDHLDGGHFWSREGGAWKATPLFLALIVIELSDIMFATDSIPAIFGITRDPFIVFTSNILAVLGLRAMYFLFVSVSSELKYLRYGLASVLCFVGFKLLTKRFFEIPIWLSLTVVLTCLVTSILASVIANRRSKRPSGFPRAFGQHAEANSSGPHS